MKIEVSNLKKTFGEKTAVDIQQFTIQKGDLLGLVGNNGAGKTTFFRLILDLLKADDGQVLIPLPAQTSETGEVGEEITINPVILTPEEYFYFVGKVNGMSKEQVDERLKDFEHFMGGEVLGQKKLIRNLSAGNKQKVGIISTLLNKPKLVILDEPFNFLDPSSQNILKHKLKEYNQETGSTILISSHNLAHTVDVCPRIALLEQGVIIRDLQNENGSAEKELEEYFDRDDN